MQEVQSPFPLGTIIRGRYLIEEVLYENTSGIIYLVKDQQAGQKLFALKEIMNPSKDERHRFTLDPAVQSLSELHHPSLPHIYKLYNDDKHGRAYMLMQYIDGSDLEMLRQTKPEKSFSITEVQTLLDPIVQAVVYMHAQKPPLLHREIAPTNIVIPITGGAAAFAQFGISEEYIQDAILTDLRQSLPGYRAPEQYDLESDVRTDVYGLAATCYTLLTGSVPINAFYRSTKWKKKHTDTLVSIPVIAPKIPSLIAECIQRGMSIQPNERFSNIEAFWRAFNKAVQEEASKVIGAPMAKKIPSPTTQVRQQEEKLPVAALSPKSPAVSTQAEPVAVRSIKRTMVFMALGLLLLLSTLGSLFVFTSGSHSANTALSPIQKTATAPQSSQSQNTALTNTPHSQPTATHTKFVPSPTAGYTPVPTMPVTPVPYPTIGGSYIGTAGNILGQMKTTLTLANIMQSQGAINGSFDGWQIHSLFSGFIDSVGHIHFTVTDSSGHTQFTFDGNVQSANSLSGSYTSCSISGNSCQPQSSGIGLWQVSRL